MAECSDTSMKSPTGREIQGTYERIPGTASVKFFTEGVGPVKYEHDGNGTKVFWDGSDTQVIEGVAILTDENGEDWLEHHLIPESVKAVPMAIKDYLNEEFQIGYALRAARSFEQRYECLTEIPDAGIHAHVVSLTKRYEAVKQRNIQLIKDHVNG